MSSGAPLGIVFSLLISVFFIIVFFVGSFVLGRRLSDFLEKKKWSLGKFLGILLAYFIIVPFLIILAVWLFETILPMQDIPYAVIVSKSPFAGLEFLFSSGVLFTSYLGTNFFVKAPLFSVFFVGGIALAIGYLITESRKPAKHKIAFKALCFVIFLAVLLLFISSQNYFALSEQALKSGNPGLCDIGFEKSISGSRDNCGEYFGCGYVFKRNSQHCKEIYYTTMAKKNSDVSYCEKIEYANKRLPCFYELAVETKDPEICLKIAANPSDDFYYSTLGSRVSTRDCLVDIAVQTKDISVCRKIEARNQSFVGSIEGCIYSVAVEAKDKTICEEISIEDPDRISSCITAINDALIKKEAIENGDISICDQLSNWNMKYDCEVEVEKSLVTKEAIQKNDKTICKKLEIRTRIEECENALKASVQQS